MNIKKILLVIFISCFIELCIINFSNILDLLNSNTNKNIIYNINDVQTINWEKDSGKLISDIDPMLVMYNVNSDVKKVEIQVEADKEIPYIDVFYTNQNTENFNGELLVHYNTVTKNSAKIKIDQYVKDLRVDLGDDAGLTISNIKIIINPTKIDFSISRVIAMILIYYLTVGLLSLQKNPYYKIKGDK